ncbi:MAG: hypothetical protein COT73_08070 [Bdellovibrio sp. CG10_big_fil_rev_8_21_14_0_10_47_8]|nr:MAG: hypothetical protein COT73_08070 [Bdellovibrio sp. CG10_big_fil_rev_8_21_14_0_10_47_8]
MVPGVELGQVVPVKAPLTLTQKLPLQYCKSGELYLSTPDPEAFVQGVAVTETVITVHWVPLQNWKSELPENH